MNVFKIGVNESDAMDFVLPSLSIESTIIDTLGSKLNSEPFRLALMILSILDDERYYVID